MKTNVGLPFGSVKAEGWNVTFRCDHRSSHARNVVGTARTITAPRPAPLAHSFEHHRPRALEWDHQHLIAEVQRQQGVAPNSRCTARFLAPYGVIEMKLPVPR